MTDPRKDWCPASEEPGVGMLDDGKLNVVTPEQHAQRAMERDAEEAIEDEQPEDFADLADGADEDPV